MDETPHDRLRIAREEAGYDQAEFARKLEMPLDTYRSHETGRRGIKPPMAKRYAEALGRSWKWLLLGNEDEAIDIAATVLLTERPAVVVADQIVTIAGTDYAMIPVYDIRAAAGAGAINHDVTPVDIQPYSVNFLRTVTHAPAAALAVIRVSGDSMESTLYNGDHVLVDRSVHRIMGDGIYVLRFSEEDELRVKRVQRHAKSKLLSIVSDNPRYTPDKNVSDDDIFVEGRVVWLGRNVGG